MVDVKSAPTFPTWYSLYHFQSVGLKAKKYDKDEIEDSEYELYMDKFVRPIADICGCNEASVGSNEIAHVLTYVKEKKFNYFYRVADIVANNCRAIPQDQRLDKIDMIFDGFFKNHTACYIITKGGNPVVGYAVKRGDLVGVPSDKFARIGNVSKRTGNFDIKTLAATPPTQVKTADRKLLKELCRVGIISERSLAKETVNCLDANGNLVPRTVNCLSPDIPAYDVSVIIADLPQALVQEYENEYVAALEFAKQSSDSKHRAMIPVLQRMLKVSRDTKSDMSSNASNQDTLNELLEEYLTNNPDLRDMSAGNLLEHIGGSSQFATGPIESEVPTALKYLGVSEDTANKYNGDIKEIAEDALHDILSTFKLSEESINTLYNRTTIPGKIEFRNVERLVEQLGVQFDYRLLEDEAIVDTTVSRIKEHLESCTIRDSRKLIITEDRRNIMSRIMQTFRVSTESARILTDTEVSAWTEDIWSKIQDEAAENLSTASADDTSKKVIRAVLETCGDNETTAEAMCAAKDDELMSILDTLYRHATYYVFSDAMQEVFKIDQDEMDKLLDIDILTPDTESIEEFRSLVVNRIAPTLEVKNASEIPANMSAWTQQYFNEHENINIKLENVNALFDFIGMRHGFIDDVVGSSGDDLNECMKGARDTAVEKAIYPCLRDGLNMSTTDMSELLKLSADTYDADARREFFSKFTSNQDDVSQKYEDHMMTLLGLTDEEVCKFMNVDLNHFTESDKTVYAHMIADRIIGERPSLQDMGLSDWSIAFITKAGGSISLENIDSYFKSIGADTNAMYELVRNAENVDKYANMVKASSVTSTVVADNAVASDVGYLAGTKILTYIRTGILSEEDPEFRAKVVPLIKTFSRMAFLAPDDTVGGAEFLERVAGQVGAEQADMLKEVATFVRSH